MKKTALSFLLFMYACLGIASFSLADDSLWIDVRTNKEYAEDHIQGDINIPHDKIAEEIGKTITDKNTDIHLYCRSGKRAGLAQETLKKMGYTHVTNEGGIADARKKRHLDSSNQ